MKANEFVKKFGWDFSKAFSLKSNELRKALPNDIGEGFCVDLKRLVESWALVELCGGLDIAKNLDPTLLNGWVESVNKAIADVESCQ